MEIVKLPKVAPGDVEGLAKVLDLSEADKAKLAELYQKVQDEKKDKQKGRGV